MRHWLCLLGTLFLVACAPVMAPPGATLQPPRLVQDHIIARDGTRLPLRVWRAEGRERAVFIALHGFNDYSNAFAEPGRFWARHGITTYAYDQRGFGATAQRGYWPGTDALARDLKDIVPLVAVRHAGKPLYLVGESMGGAVVMTAMADPDAPQVDGLVLAAPAVWGRSTMNPLARGLLWFAAHTVPWYPATGRGLRINVLASDNIDMLRALGRDPLIIRDTRTDAVWGLANLMDAALAAAPRLKPPLLILYGSRDELIPKGPVERMVDSLAAPARVAVYPDGWHMLFRDLQRETVWRDVLAWTGDRSAPLPSGAEQRDRPLFAGR